MSSLAANAGHVPEIYERFRHDFPRAAAGYHQLGGALHDAGLLDRLIHIEMRSTSQTHELLTAAFRLFGDARRKEGFETAIAGLSFGSSSGLRLANPPDGSAQRQQQEWRGACSAGLTAK